MRKLVVPICTLWLALLIGSPQRAHAGGSPVIGELKLFAGDFAPKNWMFCEGQELRIAQFTALYSVLGTAYGGDGRTTFGLPDMTKFEKLMAGRTGNKSRYIIAVAGTYPVKDKIDGIIGEIRLFAGYTDAPNRLPKNWKYCEGQKLSPKDYPALADVLLDDDKKPLYGEKGQLPDLRNSERAIRKILERRIVPRYVIVVDGYSP